LVGRSPLAASIIAFISLFIPATIAHPPTVLIILLALAITP
jgi:hypothetical protein